MNTKPGPRKKAPQLLALAGFVSLANAPSAMAEQADANGSVSLFDQANAGVAFNIGTQALSGILLGGAQASALTLQLVAALPQSIASTSGKGPAAIVFGGMTKPARVHRMTPAKRRTGLR